MKSVFINYKRITRQLISLGTKISLCSENFASSEKFRYIAKLHRDSEIREFRYALAISLASEISLA